MENAPLVGVHGLQRYPLAGLLGAVGHADGQLAQGLFPLGAVIFRVQRHPQVILPAAVDAQAGEILHRIQGFTPAADEHAHVFAGHLHPQLFRGFHDLHGHRRAHVLGQLGDEIPGFDGGGAELIFGGGHEGLLFHHRRGHGFGGFRLGRILALPAIAGLALALGLGLLGGGFRFGLLFFLLLLGLLGGLVGTGLLGGRAAVQAQLGHVDIEFVLAGVFPGQAHLGRLAKDAEDAGTAHFENFDVAIGQVTVELLKAQARGLFYGLGTDFYGIQGKMPPSSDQMSSSSSADAFWAARRSCRAKIMFIASCCTMTKMLPTAQYTAKAEV